MKGLFSSLVAAAVVILFATQVLAATLVVADFNSGNKLNNIAGKFGTWDYFPGDNTQSVKMILNPGVKHGDIGFSLQIDYDVDSPNMAYNGFWMKLQDTNLTAYDKLTLWIKGDETAGFTTQISLELKDSNKVANKYTLTGITKNWQQVSIPLTSFAGDANLKMADEFIVVFSDIVCAGKKQGTIYIDDIEFKK